MNNTFYFLRHGKTKADENIPVSKWVLSEEGKQEAEDLAKSGIFDAVEVIYSSTEEKASQTAKPIAEKLGKEIIKIEALSELNRDKGGFMDSEKYEKTAKDCLENPGESIENWEPASQALKRFENEIVSIEKENENKKILIIGHGYTINMYFAKLLGIWDKVYKRLKSNTFADWGIIKNGKVIKDLGK